MTENALHSAVSHLINRPGDEWAFWRWVCIRSTGFPFNGILKLATPELSTFADKLNSAIRASDNIWLKANQEVDSALQNLASTYLCNEKKTRKELLNARINIRARKLPLSLPESLHLESIAELEIAIQQIKLIRAQFNDAYLKSVDQTSEVISEIAGLPTFREAITWQNREVLLTLDSIIQKSNIKKARNSRQRQNEELVALYWQRYCTKNDTIGFFGPVGWAQFTPDVEYLSIKPGEQLVSSRKIYWEVWAIEELALAIVRKYKIQPWVRPILMPFVRLDGQTLHHPKFAPIQLDAGRVLLLESCNGHFTAKEIAAQILNFPEANFLNESEIYQFLSEMSAKQLIHWQINIPMGSNPEYHLRESIEQIEDPEIKRLAMESFEALDSAKMRVEAAAGDHENLNSALNDLEQLFVQTTGLQATRNKGMVYAGRTIIYEDCLREVEMLLGRQMLNSFVTPLSLLLMAGRWFSSQLALAYRNKIMEIYSAHVQSTNNPLMGAEKLLAHLAPLLFEDSQNIVAPVQELFSQKWEQVLHLGDSTEPVKYSYDELYQSVLREFSSSSPGWIGARYHSPDIMIMADSDEAICRGDCLFVLGEVHMCTNTLDSALFVNQHPSPDELLDAVEHDLAGLTVIPQPFKTKNMGCRTTPSLVPKSIFQLEFLANSFISDRSKSLPLSSLVIELQNETLIARSRDGRHRISIIDMLGRLLSFRTIDCFKLLTPRSHTPRISIDNLIIKRESWSFTAFELQYLYCLDPAETFLQIREWAKIHSLPRFVFFKAPVEKKPIYLDFESSILVSIFAKLIRRTVKAGLSEERIDLSEMLPNADQLFLKDNQGHRYTCEFRMVAVDIMKQ